MTPCSLVIIYMLSTPNMEARRSSELFLYLYQTTRRHKPEDRNPHIYIEKYAEWYVLSFGKLICLFNDALSNSDILTSNISVVKKIMIWKSCGRKRSLCHGRVVQPSKGQQNEYILNKED